MHNTNKYIPLTHACTHNHIQTHTSHMHAQIDTHLHVGGCCVCVFCREWGGVVSVYVCWYWTIQCCSLTSHILSFVQIALSSYCCIIHLEVFYYCNMGQFTPQIYGIFSAKRDLMHVQILWYSRSLKCYTLLLRTIDMFALRIGVSVMEL